MGGFGRRANEVPSNSKAVNQLWIYENGFIKSRLNGHVVDVKGAAKDKGTPVMQIWSDLWNPHSLSPKVIVHENKNALNQQWDLTPEGYLVSRASGHVLDIPEAR